MWKTRKKLLVLSAVMIIIALATSAYAGSNPPGPGTANSPGTFADPHGSLAMTQALPFKPYNGTDNAQNDTITFDVLGIESLQPPAGVVFTVTTTGALTVKFIGSQPTVACSSCTKSYAGTREVISYAGAGSDTLTVLWTANLITGSETNTVLFRDDFLYTNPLLETSWTVDQYHTPGATAYTSSGYLILKANNQTLQTAHVTSSIFNPSAYTTGTAVKRKMTVALVPFAKTETPATAYVRAGINPLLSSGPYPSTGPYGTPFVDINSNCVSNGGANDNIGADFMDMNNAGAVFVRTCGDGGSNQVALETGLNPSLYTVFTVETYGIFCSTCTDNAYIGSSWVYFRAYQETSTGLVIQSTDKNLNFTSNVAPLFQTSYAFVDQANTNAGATGQISKIDIVQVQNYGSPVCLIVPTGEVCTRLPPVPPGIIGTTGIVGMIAWLANQVGGGDEQLGAIILFLGLSFGFAIAPFLYTRHFIVLMFGELAAIGFYVYAGFFPQFVLIGVFVATAILLVMTFAKFFGGAATLSSGDSE